MPNSADVEQLAAQGRPSPIAAALLKGSKGQMVKPVRGPTLAQRLAAEPQYEDGEPWGPDPAKPAPEGAP